MKRFANPQMAPGKRPYSPGVQVGRWSHMSGHVPVDAQGNSRGGTAKEQAAIILNNLEKTLSAIGGCRSDFVATSVFLTDISDIDAVDAAYREFFDDHAYPARTTVQVAALGRAEFRVEIAAVAYVHSQID